MAVHYKFVSSRDYDTVKFDGGFITVADLKLAISAQKKLDRSGDMDLLITNATTGEGPFGAAYAYAYAYALHTNSTPCTALLAYPPPPPRAPPPARRPILRVPLCAGACRSGCGGHRGHRHQRSVGARALRA